MLETYWQDVKNWAAHPYREEGTVVDWFLFVGIWVVATILWVKVIHAVAD